jgi:hypothetical protein
LKALEANVRCENLQDAVTRSEAPLNMLSHSESSALNVSSAALQIQAADEKSHMARKFKYISLDIRAYA